jgi:hypothetical protein
LACQETPPSPISTSEGLFNQNSGNLDFNSRLAGSRNARWYFNGGTIVISQPSGRQHRAWLHRRQLADHGYGFQRTPAHR